MGTVTNEDYLEWSFLISPFSIFYLWDDALLPFWTYSFHKSLRDLIIILRFIDWFYENFLTLSFLLKSSWVSTRSWSYKIAFTDFLSCYPWLLMLCLLSLLACSIVYKNKLKLIYGVSIKYFTLFIRRFALSWNIVLIVWLGTEI